MSCSAFYKLFNPFLVCDVIKWQPPPFNADAVHDDKLYCCCLADKISDLLPELARTVSEKLEERMKEHSRRGKCHYPAKIIQLLLEPYYSTLSPKGSQSTKSPLNPLLKCSSYLTAHSNVSQQFRMESEDGCCI